MIFLPIRVRSSTAEHAQTRYRKTKNSYPEIEPFSASTLNDIQLHADLLRVIISPYVFTQVYFPNDKNRNLIGVPFKRSAMHFISRLDNT